MLAFHSMSLIMFRVSVDTERYISKASFYSANTSRSSSGGRTGELTGLFVLRDRVARRKKKGRTAALIRAAHFILPQQCLPSPRCIQMDGLYSSLCPFKHRAPMGIQFSCNNNGNILPPREPHNPRQAVIITVTSGPGCLPAGP